MHVRPATLWASPCFYMYYTVKKREVTNVLLVYEVFQSWNYSWAVQCGADFDLCVLTDHRNTVSGLWNRGSSHSCASGLKYSECQSLPPLTSLDDGVPRGTSPGSIKYLKLPTPQALPTPFMACLSNACKQSCGIFITWSLRQKEIFPFKRRC